MSSAHLSALTSIPHDKIMNVMIRVGISRLQSEHMCVWRGVELNNSLHWQWSVDEVRWLVVHVLNVYDYPLIVGVCKNDSTLLLLPLISVARLGAADTT